jgi:tRNA U34 5-carboxymethylaminomethyl modifying GTPase MnmE/TrmE
MGGGIAMNFANAGIPVTIVEVAQDALDRGLGIVRKNYEATASRGRLTAADVEKRMGLIHGTTDWNAIADADIVIAMLDASGGLTDEDFTILDSVISLRHMIAVNKIDKIESRAVDSYVAELRQRIAETGSVVEISAKTGEGLDRLRDAIVRPFLHEEIDSAGFLVADARHHDLLVRTDEEIRNSLLLIDQNTSEELILVGLHNALRYLGEITGETTTEDMLTRIFSTFCIGK